MYNPREFGGNGGSAGGLASTCTPVASQRGGQGGGVIQIQAREVLLDGQLK